MKKFRYFFVLLVITTHLGFLPILAQEEKDENIWSIVKVDSNTKKETKKVIDWQPAEQVAKFYEKGTSMD